MIEWITTLFPKRIPPNEEVLRLEIQRLTAELNGKDEVQKRALRVVAASVGDVEPLDEKARREYVAAASNFYSEILEKKLLQLVAQTREELDTAFIATIPLGLDRNGYDNFLRGTSNAYKVLMDWGELVKGEHLSNITKETN
jgi:hypothetical protein